MSRHQNIGQNHNIKAANRLSKNLGIFLYFRMMVTDQRCSHKKFKSRLGECLVSFFYLPICCLKIYRNIIFSFSLGDKTWMDYIYKHRQEDNIKVS